jgi:hypothetical protein
MILLLSSVGTVSQTAFENDEMTELLGPIRIATVWREPPLGSQRMAVARYNSRRRIISKVLYGLDGSAMGKLSYEYNVAGDVVKIISSRREGSADFAEVVESFQYDRQRRPLVISLLMNGSPISTERYLWNVSGDQAEVKKMGPEGLLITKTITFLNKHKGVIRSIVYDSGGTVSFEERYRYDRKGNLSRVAVHAFKGSTISDIKFSYRFDRFGNWIERTRCVQSAGDSSCSQEPEVLTRKIIYRQSKRHPVKEVAKRNDLLE